MPWDTDQPTEIRHRLREPGLFKDNSFRSKDIAPGIRLVLGKLKEPPKGKEGSLIVQAIRFDKKKFTLEQAKAWMKDHPDF